MAISTAQKKPKVEKDQFTEEGVRWFNASKPHGTIYADGYSEAKFLQEYQGEAILYRGDGSPVGYEKGKPMPKAREELLDENAQLQNRIRDLEESQKTTNALLARLSAQLDAKEGKPAPVAEAPKREAAANAGAAKPK
jgi:hypothetical protein